MKFCTERHPVPPYSFGQCETPQPFLFRMRHQATISSLERWRPSTILRRVSGGTLSLKKARTSSRNTISSLLKARSIGSSCERMKLELRDVFFVVGGLKRRLLQTKFMARELADGRAWQLIDKIERGRQLVLAHVAGQEGAHFLAREGICAIAQLDEGFGGFAAIVVRDADHDHFLHG